MIFKEGSIVRNLFREVPDAYLVAYRRVFGFIILLELLFMTDTIIHIYYENWEPCFIPILRSWEIPVTHYYVDLALYMGMFLSLCFVCDRVFPPMLNHFVNIGLFLVYTYLRVIHFYNWNNHYYLNMIMLFMFIFIPGHDESRKFRPLWEYHAFQYLFGTVYFFAGVSKYSSAWLDGRVADTMTENHQLVLPIIMLSWGGFLLDLLGGVVILANCFWRVRKDINIFVHANFFLFHLHNLLYMFKSIQFFPLHMLFSGLPFAYSIGSDPSKEHVDNRSVRRARSIRFILLWTLITLQALLATRRFFILVDSPWEIRKANDIAEFHSQVHHFSWRMKSRTCTSMVRAGGRWPTMMVIGMSSLDAAPEDVRYLWYTKMFYNRILPDPELAIQPLVNRIRRNMPMADKSKVKVNLFWWAEVNHGPFQLIVNPELNFVGAEFLPLLAVPPATHVEARVEVAPEWTELMRPISLEIQEMGYNPAVFVSREMPGLWIPNPLISAGSEQLMPRLIVCAKGKILVRTNGGENTTPCEENTPLRLPLDGSFFLQFESRAMFFLAFEL